MYLQPMGKAVLSIMVVSRRFDLPISFLFLPHRLFFPPSLPPLACLKIAITTSGTFVSEEVVQAVKHAFKKMTYLDASS